jgi:peptide/nickel transport system substrate-binding protein
MFARFIRVLPIVTLMLSACGPGAAPPSEPAKPAASQPTTAPVVNKPLELAKPEASPAAAAAPVAAASPVSAARRGGTLRVGLNAEVSTLDPHFSTSATDRHVYYAVFNTLVGLDSQLRAVPELAETVEQPDAKTVIFKLRKGVKFHDGTDFDAAAVKFNFERMMDPNGGSIRRSELASVGSVETPDPMTVVLKLKAPDASLLATLTDRAGMMVSPAAVQKYGKDLARNPVGTGPFKFTEWVKDDHLTLKRNEQYWRQGFPLLDEVTFKPVLDSTVRFTALRTGQFDIIDELAPKDLGPARGTADLEVSQVPGVGYRRIQLHVGKPPFDKKPLRQAFAAAIDRTAINKVVFQDTGVPVQGPIPPSSWAFDKEFKGYGLTADVEKAKAKLQEAGVGPGFSFTYLTETNPVQKQLAELIQENMKSIGIDMKIEVKEQAAVIDVRASGGFEAVEQNWSGRVDPDGNMYSHFITNGANNWGKYSNPKVDELLNTARETTDLQARTKAYREAEVILADDAPVIFLHSQAWLKAWNKKLRDYQELADGRFRFERSWMAN